MPGSTSAASGCGCEGGSRPGRRRKASRAKLPEPEKRPEPTALSCQAPAQDYKKGTAKKKKARLPLPAPWDPGEWRALGFGKPPLASEQPLPAGTKTRAGPGTNPTTGRHEDKNRAIERQAADSAGLCTAVASVFGKVSSGPAIFRSEPTSIHREMTGFMCPNSMRYSSILPSTPILALVAQRPIMDRTGSTKFCKSRGTLLIVK